MKTLTRITSLFVLAASLVFGQLNTMTQTSLSAAITSTQQTFTVASVTNITASLTVSTLIYVDREAMLVTSVGSPTTTSITVVRGQNGTGAAAHISGAMVLAGRPDWFAQSDPAGACTLASTYVTPVVNIANGRQWLCSTISLAWTPGWNNPAYPALPTAVVASAAGSITPSGPVFHVSGTAAVTGFTLPVGFAYGSFTVIPDAAFTTTNAGDIAIASTAVVGKALTFTYDVNSGKFYPSY